MSGTNENPGKEMNEMDLILDKICALERDVRILKNDVDILGNSSIKSAQAIARLKTAKPALPFGIPLPEPKKETPEAPDPWSDEQINLEEELKIEKASNKRLEDENTRLLDKTATLTRELVNMKRRVALTTSETLDAVRLLERTSKMVTSLKEQVAELQKYVGEHTQPKATVIGDAFPFLLNIFNRNKTPEQLESWKNDVMRQASALVCDEADGENSVYPRPPEEEGKTE